LKILIVEDDTPIVRALERGLKAHGYEVSSANGGEKGAGLAADPDVGLVLLDISLPGLSGHEVLGRIREKRPNLPVLMLTARDDLQNKVLALNSGADDYLTKPFALEELLARVGALARRAEFASGASHLQAGDLRLDPASRGVWRGEKRVELSSREFSLLEYLMRQPGRPMSRQAILKEVWGYDFDPGSNVVNVYVRYLRSKIDRPGERSLIETVRGSGYRFDTPNGEAQDDGANNGG
jgi:two-component system OmpR family response regulator